MIGHDCPVISCHINVPIVIGTNVINFSKRVMVQRTFQRSEKLCYFGFGGSPYRSCK